MCGIGASRARCAHGSRPSSTPFEVSIALSIALTIFCRIPSSCIPSSFRGAVLLFIFGLVVILFCGVLVLLVVVLLLFVPFALFEVTPLFAACYIPFLLPVPILVPVRFSGIDAQHIPRSIPPVS